MPLCNAFAFPTGSGVLWSPGGRLGCIVSMTLLFLSRQFLSSFALKFCDSEPVFLSRLSAALCPYTVFSKKTGWCWQGTQCWAWNSGKGNGKELVLCCLTYPEKFLLPGSGWCTNTSKLEILPVWNECVTSVVVLQRLNGTLSRELLSWAKAKWTAEKWRLPIVGNLFFFPSLFSNTWKSQRSFLGPHQVHYPCALECSSSI